MDFTAQKDDPHGVQRLLDILRRQQDSSSSSSSSPTTSALSAATPSSAAYPTPNPFASITPDPTTATNYQQEAARRNTYTTAPASSSRYNLSAEQQREEQQPFSFDPYSFNPFSNTAPALTSPPPPCPPPPHPIPAPKSAPSNPTPTASTSKSRDLSTLSFAESLPILSTLSSDKNLLRRLSALRTQQHHLEKQLAKDYSQFIHTAHKQFPNIKIRSQQDESRRKQILQKWDVCLQNQQTQLHRMGIPGIQIRAKEARKHKKILSVLEHMLDDEDGAEG
ncbi:uncharacterized protein UTRI_03704 [Ustilago trichophora]|uniref:Uncharacterized protein n=1 Tax=Ustilago trichophora TaxID=86804 RepID=A0A5C3E4E7_9BASI|nr:uncharacterized protein UTRI_03704 [Ustilago trichophora]